MHLIQLLLPIRTKEGAPIAEEAFARTRTELTQKFGRVTAYLRTPVRRLWKGDDEQAADELIVLEVMTQDLERRWWTDYRAILEGRFGQDEIVIRAIWAERV